MRDLLGSDLHGLTEALQGLVLPGSEGRQYPLERLIGEGGQSWVFRATWNGSVSVVVKVMRPDAVTKQSLVRFQREAEVLRMLAQQPSPNPHIVRLYDHAYATVHVAATGQSWELPFSVLEYVEGGTLYQALKQARPAGLGLGRSRRILRHIVLALEDVHACNVVHRDLKPSNVLISSQNGPEIAKVTDFGLAKVLDLGITRTTTLPGATMGYAPPEQFEQGNHRVGPQTDVFSLAAIFYELVTGVPAFQARPNADAVLVLARMMEGPRPGFGRVPEALPANLAERPDVVAAVDAELARALSPEPEERHVTVTELFAAIENALAPLTGTQSSPAGRRGSGVIVRPSSAPPPPPSPGEDERPGAPGVRAGRLLK
jgi:serine/threonine-protein kinase